MKIYALVGLTALASSVAIGLIAIPLLKKLRLGQNILSYVSEHNHKSGTPTIGGVIFILSSVLTYTFFGFKGRLSAVCLSVFVGYAAVGFIDDFIKIKLKRNEGLSVVQKTIFELVIAVTVSVFAYTRGLTEFYLPFTTKRLNVGLWSIPLCVFIFVATTNGVNLTDGLDGLAGGVTYVYFSCFSALLLLQVKSVQSDKLYDEYTSIAVLSVCLSGSLVGYLLFNTNKASVFMGDTGSLALGGMVAICAIVTGNVFYIPIIGIMYVVSCISVILQVGYFKLTNGKRLFLIAPLHHHFQHKGYTESKIAAVYKIITLFGGLVALAINA